MITLIEDVERAYEAGAYRAALALALTIPDIGSQIAYPHIETVGTRYRKWFNQYISQYYPQNSLLQALGIKTFDANACYKLRCAFLHSGGSELDIDYIQELDFFIDEDNIGLDDKGRAELSYETMQAVYTHIRLNVSKLCKAMCAGGRRFYQQAVDKSIFTRFDIHIMSSSEEISDNTGDNNG